MLKRKLGTQGLEVSAVGLGCMGMSFAYGPASDADSLRVLDRAFDIGITFWDTAEMYGPWKNEELLGHALLGKPRAQLAIATKFSYRFSPDGRPLQLDSSPAHIRRSVEGSLKRLGTDYIDLYYQHRVDPKTPIEDTMGAMADLVKAGKIRYVGLSEAGPGTIRRANAVHPVSALQTEYSLWERAVEEKILPLTRELGIGFVAYSPVGRGFLTGKFKSPSDLPETDWRRSNPRFQPENFGHNLKLVRAAQKMAADFNTTSAQIALAWLLRRGPDIVPIPGTRHVNFLEENAAAAALNIPESAWIRFETEVNAFETAGLRYPAAAMSAIDISE